ncbi:MAG TPA: cupredoxin domain-containing protein [Methylibium sp.]
MKDESIERSRLQLLAMLLASAVAPLVRGAEPAEQVIEMTARRFEYTPSEITVKAGVPVLLKIRSIDFVHGFSLPALQLRADLPPGQVTEVRFTAPQVGVLPFLCDNFCGEGHETMNGRIVVT